MNNKSRVFWITRTAVFIALLIVLQAATAPMGNIFVTGSIVNLLLILSVMTCGFTSGLVVAVLSPVLAKFFGIGPLWSIIPFIILGNITLILIWHLIGSRTKINRLAAHIIALAAAAVAKFAVLYFGIVMLAVPVLLQLPEQQAAVISSMFSLPQLATAAIGGAAAVIILPLLQRALKGRPKTESLKDQKQNY